MKGKSGIWIIVVAAIVLEAISCTMYFTSRAAIRQAAEERAKTELRKAELEIEMHTVEMETVAKALAIFMQNHLDQPEAVYSATRLAVRSLSENTSLAIAFVPDYYPSMGTYYEVCSSRFSEDSIYTRNIGSADHDYTQMEWYQNGFVHDSCWWCEPYLDDSGSETYVVSCSHPIYDPQGRVVAVVCVDLSLAYLKNLSENLKVYPGSYSAIRSSKGKDIVAAPDTTAGRKYNTYNEVSDATGWHIEIIIPEDVLFGDLNRTGKIVGILMLLGLGILIFIVWHSSRTSSRLMVSNALNQRIESELEIAQTIQMAMLPKVFPPFADRLDINAYGMVKPAKEVGGDLYDFYVRHDKLFFCVGDVSGKGVPAALVMATTRSLFRSVTAHEERPAHIVAEMNETLTEANDQNMFITLFVGVLDLKNDMMYYCNAGHNAPVRIQNTDRSTDRTQTLEVDANLPLGIMAGFEYTEQQIPMHYNDLLFLYTDGLTEAENSAHDQFGETRMIDALQQLNDLPPRFIVDGMRQEVERFVGNADQSDDLTMLVIRYEQPSLVMRNDIQQIPTLAEWIEGLNVPDELSMPINLALEEIVANVMLYAYPDNKSGQVMVESWRADDKICFSISDSGKPFDPTQQKEADVTLSAEEREIGGLGIHLVRQLMDEIRYERKDEKNVLILSKKL